MTNLNDVLNLLGGNPLKSRFIVEQNFVLDKVEFLSVADELADNTVYMTQENALEAELRDKYISPKSLIVCATDDELVRLHQLPQVNIVFMKLDLVRAFSALNRRMREYSQWWLLLSTSVHEHGTLSALAETCAKIANSPTFIVNANRQIVAFAGVDYSPLPFARNLARRSQLHDDLESYPSQLLHEGRRSLRLERVELSRHENLLLHLWRNSRDGQSMFSLIIEQSASSRLTDMDMLAYYTCISIFKLRERFSRQNEMARFSFQTVMNDVLAGRLTQNELIEPRLESAGIRLPENHLYRLILAEPVGSCCDLVGFSAALTDKLAGGATYGHGGKLLYLWPVPGGETIDPGLEKIFRDYGFCGCVGDRSYAKNLRMQYKILEQAAQLRDRAYWLKNRAVYSYDEIRFLNIVDILYSVVPDFYAVHDQDAVRQILSPAVEQLYEFDRKKNTNLRKVLRAYLASNCSLSDTAEQLFMHKNTVAYKLKQISGIIQDDLKDGRSNANLMISCAIMDYLEYKGK